MRELSLNILDIVENSVKAEATLIKIDVIARGNILTIRISDNGKGMDKEFLKNVTDPFTTTRTTRKVGMGIPLFKMAAEMTGGTFNITSEKGKGTTTAATFVINSIDRVPLGDLGETVTALLMDNNKIDYLFTFQIEEEKYVFDTVELKKELDGVSLDETEVLRFVKDMINQNVFELENGKIL